MGFLNPRIVGPIPSFIGDLPNLEVRKLPTSGQSKLKVEDVHTANKSLVERIRSALDFDEAKYNAFKDISGEYRQGLMDAETYVGYVNQFGLSHLVIELGGLCPDAEKQRALVETYDATLRNNGLQEKFWSKDSSHMKDGNGSKKVLEETGFDVSKFLNNDETAIALNVLDALDGLREKLRDEIVGVKNQCLEHPIGCY
ncbi:E3 ubiquitin-protein ligase ZNF598 [Camellia lanceoleosa]|nr:E3 ubiquitin-protein ligase ZNF598 [Camellia lanceoleosa]